MPIWNRVTDEKREAMFADWKGGMTYKQISARHKISMSAISNNLKKMRVKRAKPVATTAIVLHSSNGHKIRKTRYGQFAPEIARLRVEKFTAPQIAEKLKIPAASVKYYLYQKKVVSPNPTHEGESNGQQHLHPQFLAGFGCAEIERAVGTISQRLGVTPALLRSGYSKFLGYTPVR